VTQESCHLCRHHPHDIDISTAIEDALYREEAVVRLKKKKTTEES